MFPILLAAVSALITGSADFSGGRAARRAAPLSVTVIAHVLSLPALGICLVLVPGRPQPADLVWGFLAGAAGLAGVVLLYRGLAAGAMAVVAPVTAVTAAIIPIGVGLFTADSPGRLSLLGTVLAVLAIGLVSIGPARGRGHVSLSLVGLALAAGGFFGVFYLLLAQPSGSAGMWPLLAVRAGSIGLGLAIMAGIRAPFRLDRSVVPWAAGAGTLEMVGNALYLAAAARGHLSVVAAVASLYPVSTVLLALAVDRERLRPIQFAGLGLAAAALVLTTN